MRESGFIRQNEEKWRAFEELLQKKSSDPKALQKYFIQITDDLSYARTHYPARSVRVYLNQLAQKIFSSIYKRKHSGPGAFVHFWKEEVPAIMYQYRKEFLLSLIIFVLAVIIGAWSTSIDKDFPSLILGSGYVSMTEENIAKGDPMAVYKQANQVDMFLGITLNNIMVAFRVYIMGAIAGVGTVLIMLYNGIMLGSFQYYFAEKGLLSTSFLTIWQHGTLEISAIILAGGAGFVLAGGILFPGSYTRMQSLQTAARQSLRVMLSITPVFIIAGFIEGFVTRYTEVPDAIRIVTILLSAFIILGYYVLLPIQKKRAGTLQKLPEERVFSSPVKVPHTGVIRTTSEIFSDVFLLYRSAWSRIFPVVIAGSIVYAILAVSLHGGYMREHFSYMKGIGSFWDFLAFVFFFEWVNQNFDYLFYFKDNTLFFILNVLLWGVVIRKCLGAISGLLFADKMPARKKMIYNTGLAVFTAVLINACFFFRSGILWGFLLSPLPVLFAWCSMLLDSERKKDKMSTSLLLRNFGNAYKVHLLFLLVSFIVFVLLNTQLLWIFYEVVGFMVRLDAGKQSDYAYIFYFLFTTNLAIMLVLPLFIFSQALWYSSIKEIHGADGLRAYLKSKITQGV